MPKIVIITDIRSHEFNNSQEAARWVSDNIEWILDGLGSYILIQWGIEKTVNLHNENKRSNDC